MTNRFPRIHSLSTIGIKQHFNCDYLFHPSRTDFSGESGSGKSMVADMIQLILVGSRVYKSSTDSNRVREPKGMVLEPKGRQHGMGYVFLNIETRPNRYIVIGAYIESSHNKVQPFIVQAGYDWEEELTPLPSPFQYRDLLINGRVLPIGALEHQLSEVRLKQLPLRAFHQLLYANELLSLDLTKDKTLESFASIFRSFSRGKGFKTDSTSLKKFLFGDEDQGRLAQKYKEEVQAINNDFHEHQRYLAEIRVINDKHRSIKEVVRLHTEHEEIKREYLTARYWYWNGIHHRNGAILAEATAAFKESKIKSAILTRKEASLEASSLHRLKQLKQQLDQWENSHAHATHLEREATERFEKARADHASVEKVEQWANAHGPALEAVKVWHEEERDKAAQREALSRFIEHLKGRGQLRAFEDSAWCDDFDRKRDWSAEEEREIDAKISWLQALSTFTDLKDPDSLASWALHNLSFPVSHEEESVLVHFQGLPREEPRPSQSGRFLPFPKQLFDNLQLKPLDEKGFWVNLDGVHEYIEYTENRLLGTSDPNTLQMQLADFNHGVWEQMEVLKKQKQAENDLKAALFGFGGLEEAVRLFKNKEVVLNQPLTEAAHLAPQELDWQLALFQRRDAVRTEFETAKTAYLQLLQGKEGNEAKIQGLRVQMSQILEQFNIRDLEEREIDQLLEEKETVRADATKALELLADQTYIQHMELALIPSGAGLTNVLKLKASQGLHHASISQRKAGLEKSTSASGELLLQTRADCLSAFKDDFDFSEAREVLHNPDEGPNNLKERHLQAKLAFQANYDQVKLSIEDAAQLKDYSVGMLAWKLLPTVFDSSRMDLALIEGRIAERLNKLTRDVQEIGSRKIEILQRVFSEVRTLYNQYLEKVVGIDAYLKNKNHQITGGNRASLKSRKSADYPDKWMAPFRKQLHQELSTIGLFEELRKEADINDMMMRAFQAAGGSGKVTPEDLLNPKSYFDLDFDLKLDSGETNAGSQGQTYTANALLGLARLSLIEGERRKGIRLLPIDEAEGLGNNYNMLHQLAKQEGYQIISMSIETAGDILEGDQYIYIMNENNLADESSYVPPLGIFSGGNLTDDIEQYIHQNTMER